MRTRKPKRFYLYANLSQINLSVSDLSMLNGKKKIAMLENSMHEAQFQKWEKKHGVKTEHVYISDFEDSLKRLQNGEVDGVLSSETPDWGKSRSIGSCFNWDIFGGFIYCTYFPA